MPSQERDEMSITKSGMHLDEQNVRPARFFHWTSSNEVTRVHSSNQGPKDFLANDSDATPEPLTQHHRKATSNITDEPSFSRSLLFDIFNAFRRADSDHEGKLREIVRDRKAWEQLRVYLDGMLATVGLAEIVGSTTSHFTEDRQTSVTLGGLPPVRPRVMDIQYLCSSAPYIVPARPWTTVTDSDDLVSHLVSLYLTWGYPFYAFLCRETFVKHMKSGKLNSDFCSPFLVNALLANACVSP